MKYKIKRRRKTFKTKYIFMIFLLVLICIGSSYALLSTRLEINGRVRGRKDYFDVIYVNIENSSSYPDSVGNMDTYTYTFASPPTITEISMGGRDLVQNTDYTYTNGTLTIPNVNGIIVIRGENEELDDFSIKYVYGNIEFDGARYLDTNITLFSSANLDRDFELHCDVSNTTYVSAQAPNTIFNCAEHSTQPYQGFTFRRTSSSNYVFKRTSTSENTIETNYNNNDIQSITVSRIGTKLYGRVNNNSNMVEMCDYSDIIGPTNSTLIFGSDLKNQSTPFRFFSGTLSNLYFKNEYKGEEAPIILPTPTLTGYDFKGWYGDSSYTNKIGNGGTLYTPISTNDILYAKWSRKGEVAADGEDEYIYNGMYDFSQRQYIDTNMYLYSSQNIHRNFEMSFNIESLGNSTTGDTLMSAVKNVLKISDATNELMTLETSGNTAENNVKNIPNTVTNVRIVRINDSLYYSFNGRDFLKINDYTGNTNYSNLPLIFGANYNSNEAIYQEFDGILSDIHVRFISDNATLASYSGSPQGTLTTVFEHSGDYVFTGSNNIETGISLFNFENYYKDFELSFNIVSIASDNVNQASLVNSKYENSAEGYPGFVYRIDSKKTGLELTAAKAGSGSIISRPKDSVETVKISRRDKKIYIKINDEEEILAYDYSTFTSFFNTTLTIGSSKNASGALFRPFKGTLSNIVLKVEQ